MLRVRNHSPPRAARIPLRWISPFIIIKKAIIITIFTTRSSSSSSPTIIEIIIETEIEITIQTDHEIKHPPLLFLPTGSSNFRVEQRERECV